MSKTVLIGIPAHNEGKNIAKLLQSILTQKGENFIIDGIVVTCDGCTDNTAEIVKDFRKKDKRVKVIDDGKRIGQAARLNEFYKTLKSDIFITFDADTNLGHEYVISELVNAFKGKNVGLVGGTDIPVPQTTFVGKSLEAYQTFWREMITNVANGNNVHHHPGCVSAGSKELLKKVTITKGVLANDHFLYFKALENKFRFVWARDAIIYMKVPNNLTDYLKQTTRFHDSADKIRNYFGEWVEKEYSIPFSIKLKAYIKTLIKNPFYLISALVLQVIQRVVHSKYAEKNTNGIWTTIKSSK